MVRALEAQRKENTNHLPLLQGEGAVLQMFTNLWMNVCFRGTDQRNAHGRLFLLIHASGAAIQES